MHVGDRSRDAARGINISERRIFPPGNEQRKVLLGGGHHPTVARVDLVEFLEPAFPQNLEKKFVGEKSFLFLGRGDPIFDDHLLDLADGILLGMQVSVTRLR
jgi:hypothetical protein